MTIHITETDLDDALVQLEATTRAYLADHDDATVEAAVAALAPLSFDGGPVMMVALEALAAKLVGTMFADIVDEEQSRRAALDYAVAHCGGADIEVPFHLSVCRYVLRHLTRPTPADMALALNVAQPLEFHALLARAYPDWADLRNYTPMMMWLLGTLEGMGELANSLDPESVATVLDEWAEYLRG